MGDGCPEGANIVKPKTTATTAIPAITATRSGFDTPDDDCMLCVSGEEYISIIPREETAAKELLEVLPHTASC